ncbi:MAG: hypothetical protein R3C10_25640 [Pirellulales bacterium]
MSAHSLDSVVVVGTTRGSLDGNFPVGEDAFIASFVPLGPDADANMDGHIDGTDYLIWAAAYGNDPAADPPDRH